MKTITSPFTDKQLTAQTRTEKMSFRKEEFEVVYHFYEDEGHQFTTDELDEINLVQVYNQYREKYNLPFPEEIKAIREKYQLSAAKMAEILGFGTNSYRQYESGEVPSQSNARLIQLAKEPEEFRKLVLLSDTFEDKELSKVLKHIDTLIDEQQGTVFQNWLNDYVLGATVRPNAYNGYKKATIPMTIAVMRYLIKKLNPTKTSLNKLLFYTDFLHFREHGTALMGLEYRAIPYGTVPVRYDSLLEFVAEKGYINRIQTTYSSGHFGEIYSLTDKEIEVELTEEEQATLERIVQLFKGKKTPDIVQLNHAEAAWIQNHENRQVVDYRYAFALKI